jgi:hypothetical protein
VKEVTTYFHRKQVGDDLSALKAIHQQQFPGNELAVLKAADGTLLVKVAYPAGTEQPPGTLLREQLAPLLEADPYG